MPVGLEAQFGPTEPGPVCRAVVAIADLRADPECVAALNGQCAPGLRCWAHQRRVGASIQKGVVQRGTCRHGIKRGCRIQGVSRARQRPGDGAIGGRCAVDAHVQRGEILVGRLLEKREPNAIPEAVSNVCPTVRRPVSAFDHRMRRQAESGTDDSGAQGSV